MIPLASGIDAAAASGGAAGGKSSNLLPETCQRKLRRSYAVLCNAHSQPVIKSE